MYIKKTVLIVFRMKNKGHHPVLLSKAWNLRRLVSLLAQEITPSFSTKTKPVHNPNLCTRAFAESNKFSNQGALSIVYLVSIAGVGSQTLAAVFASLGGDSSC